MFKMVEQCSKPYDIHSVNSRAVLDYQHQLELEQKKTDDLKLPKLDKYNLAKTIENKVLHLRLMRGVRGVSLVYVVRQLVKVADMSPEYSAFLNLDEEKIVRAQIVNIKSNLKQTQKCKDNSYVSWQCDAF